MSIQYPKLKGFQLPSWEEVHYLRDPPKSVFTRKYEPVSEGDTIWRVRNDESIYSDHIQYIPRGINPMVDVSYSNIGLASNAPSMNPVQPSLPYKVEVVRPPLFKLKDLMPLSRMKHDNYGFTVNPGLASESRNDLHLNVDRAPIKDSINKEKKGYLVESHVSNLQTPLDSLFSSSTPIKLNEKETKYSAVTIPAMPGYSTLEGTTQLQKDLADLSNIKLKPLSQYTLISSVSPNLKLFHIPDEATSAPNNTKEATNINVMGIVTSDIKLYGQLLNENKDAYTKEHILNAKIDFIPASFIFYNPDTRDSQEIKVKDIKTISMEINKGLPVVVGQTKSNDPIKVKDYIWKEVQTTKGKSIQIQPLNTNIQLMRDELGKTLHGSFETTKTTTTGNPTQDRQKEGDKMYRRITNIGGMDGRGNIPNMKIDREGYVLKEKRMRKNENI